MIHLRSLAAFARDVVAAFLIRHAETVGRSQVWEHDDCCEPIPRVPADHETTPTHDTLWAEVVEDNAATFMHEHGLTDPVGFCEVMGEWLRMKSEVES